ncbi:FAD-binding and (Fe-S)-binding domain-containing protein [Halobacterium jilantaiense]|uniref:D-lactate dehydrogenase (cytochrome) n=1 Tax=Halobacterium jilantaiense TaxID=355548 RepID=A0A1I0PN19_9EURY|nr:FAD-binding and (Fe-S)-binding domain-containing protein [Halobacterium jilantaiense]SEW15733.1 FAD/FMN-containing dehydrogenase [Halobacterium jilantaiense]
MATHDIPPDDPAADSDADYDYVSDSVERPALLADLRARVDGDVRFDSYTRQLYATDASIYEVLPVGVVFPTSTADVAAVVEYCADEGIPVLPRGGGTSLAGQTVNEAVVLDFKHDMDGFVGVDPESETARAQPGITLAELNDELAEHGLKYAPDPAWGDKSVLGGAIGNNSTGAHSLVYEKADGYLESAEVVLADGTVTTFGWVDTDDLDDLADPDGDLEARIYAEVQRVLDEEADEIRERFPDLKRNVSGFNYDRLLADAEEHGAVNVARLLAGSEGTLGIVTKAEVSLEPVPEETAVAMLTYDDVVDAMRDVAPILEHDPSAVEVMDDVFLDLARDTDEFRDVVDLLPEGTDSTLLVEFYADSETEARQRVANLVADRLPTATPAGDPAADAGSVTDDPVHAVDVLEAYDDDRQAHFWKMRKAGLPILLSRTSDDKHWPYIEDTAIPAEHLPEFVADFQAILDDLDTFASYYAHAGPGVLHVRPLVNLKEEEGVAKMEEIADRVTDLVVEYGGSVSGEHGDGRARTQWNRKFYGDDLWASFRETKSTFDPEWILNPGQVCGDEAGESDMTDNLRFDPNYEFDAGFDPALNWDTENGFRGMTELCHGCAGCTGYQETTGGVMCPTYRAADEEVLSTRGRANMLRSAMNGNLPDDPLDDEFLHEVMDLCVGCKGCKLDCPSGVDMAKLKTEVKHADHQENGVSLIDRVFGHTEELLELGSLFAPLSNWATSLPGADALAEKTVGIAAERDLPEFQRETLRKWFDRRGGSRIPESAADRKVLLLPDPYTNYSKVDVGKAAVRVLEAAGVHVEMPDGVGDSGRPAYSRGLVDRTRETARENVDALAPRVRDGWDLAYVEPSDAVMLQSDYLDVLLPDPGVADADIEAVAANTYGVCEYLDSFRLDEGAGFDASGESLAYHGHCHQTAEQRDHHAVGVLRRAGYEVDPLDSTCCGMAGSFGYEAEHYSMSQAIGDILVDQVSESDADTVTAPGSSCRTQLGERDDVDVDGEPPHPVEKLADAL